MGDDSSKFASLVILSYKRPDMLVHSMQSLQAHTPPAEIIVVDDGSRDECLIHIYKWLRQGTISTAILNGGPNRGVGEGMRRGFRLASGDYLVKLDADLEYRDGWLEKAMAALERYPDIGCIGWFDYHTYTPDDPRFNKLEERSLDGQHSIWIVDDFVSSAMMLRAGDYRAFGEIDSGSEAFAEDFVYKNKLVAAGMKLAILSPDLIINHGFGLGKSTVVVPGDDGKPHVADIHKSVYLT